MAWHEGDPGAARMMSARQPRRRHRLDEANLVGGTPARAARSRTERTEWPAQGRPGSGTCRRAVTAPTRRRQWGKVGLDPSRAGGTTGGRRGHSPHCHTELVGELAEAAPSRRRRGIHARSFSLAAVAAAGRAASITTETSYSAVPCAPNRLLCELMVQATKSTHRQPSPMVSHSTSCNSWELEQ